MAALSKSLTSRREGRGAKPPIQMLMLCVALPIVLGGAAAAQAPQRIVSLIPATTEMLFAMGAGRQIAGVSNYDRFPPDVERLPRVGGLLDPNVERLLALKPDLVIVYDTQTDLKRQLERAKIPMFRYSHRGLPDITGDDACARRTRRGEGRRRCRGGRMEQQLEAIRTRVAGRPRPKTLLVFGREQGSLRHINASGGYGFLHDMLELAGGADVLGDLNQQSVDMSTEMILTRAPDVILELHYGESLRPERMEAERLRVERAGIRARRKEQPRAPARR